MITIGGIKLKHLTELQDTWNRDDQKYTSPDGNVILWIGYGCEIGYGCDIGYGCKIGSGCEIGSGCKIGSGYKIGSGCKIGNCCNIGYGRNIGYGCEIGSGCEIGNCCDIGYGYKIGSHCKIGSGYNLPVPPLLFCGPRHPIGYYSPGMVNSGCITKPITWWEEHIVRCAEEHKYSDDEIKEYAWRVKSLADWMRLWNVYEAPEQQPEGLTP